MDETNPILRSTILEVVDNQLRDNDPPETRQTYKRLMADRCSASEAKRLIACVVVSELFEVMKQGRPFDQARFAAALSRLPALPWEE